MRAIGCVAFMCVCVRARCSIKNVRISALARANAPQALVAEQEEPSAVPSQGELLSAARQRSSEQQGKPSIATSQGKLLSAAGQRSSEQQGEPSVVPFQGTPLSAAGQRSSEH